MNNGNKPPRNFHNKSTTSKDGAVDVFFGENIFFSLLQRIANAYSYLR